MSDLGDETRTELPTPLVFMTSATRLQSRDTCAKVRQPRESLDLPYLDPRHHSWQT